MANPSDKPSWIHLSIKLTTRDADWIVDKLVGAKVLGVLSAGTALGGKLPSRRAFKAVCDILAGIMSGAIEANVWIGALNDGGVRATATIMPTYANSAGKTLTFTYGNLVITLTEGATGAQGFARGASLATNCAAIVACINAHPILGGLFVASTNSTLVTLTSKTDGAGAPITLGTSDGTAYALVQFSGGTRGTARLFYQHFLSNRLP